MRTIILFFFALIISTTVLAQELKTADDSLSYSLGVLIGRNLQMSGYEKINTDLFVQGFKTMMANQPTVISSDACELYIQQGAEKNKMKNAETNRVAGESFLANNKTRKGVVTLDSGLQYEIIREGSGVKPGPTDEVIVHYHGTTIDGSVFDSSVDRGESISFPLNRVIRGWTEALQLMPVGSKWKVYIPYQLAYGEQSPTPAIPPYSALIFEIELLGIK